MSVLHLPTPPARAQAAFDVLLVDDEPSIRNVLSDTLAHGGYSFKCANNGRAAVTALAGARFRLIVTDIHMPEMDGLEVIMHCSATTPRTPILAISGGGVFANADLSLKPARLLGSWKILPKPFSGPAFLTLVREMIGPPIAAGGSS